jgi:hypothetical protein
MALFFGGSNSSAAQENSVAYREVFVFRLGESLHPRERDPREVADPYQRMLFAVNLNGFRLHQLYADVRPIR